MPKMKTRKSAAKRYKITGTGRVLHKRTGMSHLRSGKSSRRKRRLRLEGEVRGEPRRKLHRLLPYHC
jgi:large subunit ribosomal protein L35